MRITETLSSAGLTDHTSFPSSDMAMAAECVGPADFTTGTTTLRWATACASAVGAHDAERPEDGGQGQRGARAQLTDGGGRARRSSLDERS